MGYRLWGLFFSSGVFGGLGCSIWGLGCFDLAGRAPIKPVYKAALIVCCCYVFASGVLGLRGLRARAFARACARTIAIAF